MFSSIPASRSRVETSTAVAKNATTAPVLRAPAATRNPAISRHAAITISGISQIRALSPEKTRLRVTSVSRSPAAFSENSPRACSPRPRALSTRIPCTDSSTSVASSHPDCR